MSDNLDELREALRRRRAKAPRRSQTDSDKPDACALNLKPNLKLGRLELADDSAETYTDKDASLSSKDNTIIIDYDRAPLIITDHLYRDYVKYQFPAMCCVFLIFFFCRHRSGPARARRIADVYPSALTAHRGG